jgi:hypothetical protein
MLDLIMKKALQISTLILMAASSGDATWSSATP